MNLRPSLTIAAAVAACAPVGAIAAGAASALPTAKDSACTSLYCIPQQPVFAFARVAKSASRCSVDASFTVEPQVSGGAVHLELRGVARHDRGIDRSAHPALDGKSGSFRFAKLRAGAYKLTGWYEGAKAGEASTHDIEHLTLHCG
jgi:hypothetical protein